MAMYNRLVFVKTFKHKVSKKAYLKACGWLAQHIYSNVELSKHVVVSIDKQPGEFPAFTVKVYVVVQEEEVKETFCKHCKTLHTIFYSVDGMDCNKCKANAYFKELDKQLENKAKFVNEILEDEEHEEEK